MTEKILMFNRWDSTQVTVADRGLQNKINLVPIVIPRTGGRVGSKGIHKSDINIVERLINKLMVPGHRGKKHKISSGMCVGNAMTITTEMRKAFEMIEKKAGQNPLQILVRAVENSALLEEIASYRLGGIIARKSVVASPQRRLDLALRHLSQGIYKATFKNKRRLHEVIADELILAANNDARSFAVQERNRLEKEAEGAR